MVRQALPSLARSPKPEARGPDPGAPLASPYPDFPRSPQGRAPEPAPQPVSARFGLSQYELIARFRRLNGLLRRPSKTTPPQTSLAALLAATFARAACCFFRFGPLDPRSEPTAQTDLFGPFALSQIERFERSGAIWAI